MKKTLIYIVSILLILFILFALYNSKNYIIKKSIDAKDFKTKMETKGYIVEDITDETEYDNVEKAYSAVDEKEGYSVDFYQFISSKYAIRFFKSCENNLQRYKQNGYYSTTTINLLNYSVYDQKDNRNYGIVSRIGATGMRSISSSEDEKMVNDLFIELGYTDNLEKFFDNPFFIIICVVFPLFIIICLWRIFEKAEIHGWCSIIPFYNLYLLAKMTYDNGWLILLLFIPGVNAFFIIFSLFKFAKAFGKSIWFGFGLWFLMPIFLAILAFGKAQYIGEE